MDRVADLALFLSSQAARGITGKLISAIWDDWECWQNHIDELMYSDLYTLRRIAGRDRLALPGRGVSLTAEEVRAQAALEQAFREAGLAPPDVRSAATAAGVPAAVADRVSKLMVRQKTLVKVDTLLFHSGSLDRLKQDVLALKGKEGAAKVDVAGFKERYGI